MADSDDLDAEIQYLWHKYVDDIKRRCPDLDVDPDAFRALDDLLFDIDTESTKALRSNFGRELRLLDECISWLAHLHLALHECLPSGEHPVTGRRNLDRVRACWALVGFATSYAVAIRRLALSGLDSPGRAVRRAMRESLLLCIVLVRRADLAQRYVDGKEGDRLWYQELRPARLSEHLLDIESEIPEVGRSIADALGRSRRSADDLDTEAVHPSYAAAYFAGFARTPKSPEIYELATLGRVSLAHGRLLHGTSFLVWHFAALAGNWLLVGPDSPIRSVMDADPTKRGGWNQIAIGQKVLMDAYLLEMERTSTNEEE